MRAPAVSMQPRVVAGTFARIYDPSPRPEEPWYINDHTIWRDRTGVWHMAGITHQEPRNPPDEKHLAHATAASLKGPWHRQEFCLNADPAAGETVLWAPHVIDYDGLYWMFYCAGGTDDAAFRIHLATSSDSWRWTRHPANPLVADGYHARDPMVIRVADRWIMYYTANDTPNGGHHVVAACESTDLLHWTGRHIVFRDDTTGTYGGPCESPYVVQRGERFYLFFGPWPNKTYRGTRVIVSDDPLSFTVTGQEGYIDAHALEVVTDEQGHDWCTHCGWGQGGLYLAPLTWD